MGGTQQHMNKKEDAQVLVLVVPLFPRGDMRGGGQGVSCIDDVHCLDWLESEGLYHAPGQRNPILPRWG